MDDKQSEKLQTDLSELIEIVIEETARIPKILDSMCLLHEPQRQPTIFIDELEGDGNLE